MRPERTLSEALGGLIDVLGHAVAIERDRWFLWLPAFLGTGIGIYFSLTVEPPLWLGLALAALAVIAVALARWRERGIAAVLALAAIAIGFAAAEIETWAVAAPVLERPTTPRVLVEGRVVEVEPLPEGRRITLEPRRIGELPRPMLPARVRITLRDIEGAAIPGEGISVPAQLFPPSGPAMPGAYDFQRRAYFDRLGAVGYAQGPLRPLPAEAPPTWRAWVASLRVSMSARIMAALPGTTGGIAAAIITGETHAIPEADDQAFRDAGLAHILVIAGLHMGLVAGLAFFAVRAGLALVPWIALRISTKKAAAVAALMVTFGYLLLSGATVSSRRSFVMTTLVLLAILVDRLSISARALAWAGLAIMLASPYSVTTAAFQMSFAAVAGLVAFYETFRERIGGWYRDAGLARRWGLHLLAIVFTTVVTTIATTPFTVFHFNRYAIYSVAANIVAVPITGLWVLPWAMLACALMPFGLERVALVPMGWGIDVIADVAHIVTSWPGAAQLVPSMPVWGLMLLGFGGFWLCVWRRRWRLLGLAPILVGYLTLLLPRPPDVLIDGESHLVAVRGADGSYLVSGHEHSRYTEDTWARRGAVGRGALWPQTGASADGTLACDREGCLYKTSGRSVALERGASALAEDCARADLVVVPVPNRGECRAKPVIDSFDTWRNGSYAVWLGTHGITIESVRDWRGERPWVPTRGPDRAALSSAARAQPAGPAP
ncbi:MAG TPA: ComEC/Rec2 family competence protein [Stellaceae bacterium]|nr:ComEC/Rec2 family competence protein [Stellaceae bacterium]